jgi:hypothetical protein
VARLELDMGHKSKRTLRQRDGMALSCHEETHAVQQNRSDYLVGEALFGLCKHAPTRPRACTTSLNAALATIWSKQIFAHGPPEGGRRV